MSTILLLIFIVTVNSECENTNTPFPSCTTLEDVLWEGTAEWTSLEVTGTETSRDIHNIYLANVPNLEKLQIENIARSIDLKAFEGLDKLSTLILKDNHLGWWNFAQVSNTNVRKLYMSNNGVDFLRGCWRNIRNLKELGIEEERWEVLEKNVFSTLHVEKLALRRNGIRRIENGAFWKMSSLRILMLCGNGLEEFNAEGIFGVSNLEKLYMNANSLRKLSVDMFRPLSKLKTLSLGKNLIETIEYETFWFLDQLEDLCLSSNLLKTVQPDGFPRKLTTLNLSYNRITFLPMDQLRHFETLREISISGNPLQCSCWYVVKMWLAKVDLKQSECSNDKFRMGLLPKCVVWNRSICVEDPGLSEKLARIYQRALEEYEDLPDCVYIRGYSFLGSFYYGAF